MRLRALPIAALLAVTFSMPPARAAMPLTIVVDARDVSRNVLHVTLHVPVADGKATLVFPKWVPGEHAPANPVVDLVLLAGAVNGKRVTWQRDQIDLFRFTFDVPADASELDVRYDALLAPGKTTPRLALIDWEPAILYPLGSAVAQTPVTAALLLPAGWQFATALDAPKRTGDRIDFATVPLERLIDSPVLAGANLSVVTLGTSAELDVASDAAAPAVIDPKVKAHFVALMAESQAIFGSGHWRAPYHFLITATDAIGYTGLEHHESSWNGVNTETLATEAASRPFAGNLLTHEFTHSWNGKFRRPAGMVRSDYQADETTDLLWVYEGLTQYYSDVLASRAGFWSAQDYRSAIGARYAGYDATPGRLTRTLADTTFQARLGRSTATFAAERRGQDYYMEGELMWLDADTFIREKSNGKRSLDDFARAFYGGYTGGPPIVVPYTRADIVATLTAVQPNDWDGFLHARLDVPTEHPPLAGITRGGYGLTFAASAPPDPNAGLARGATTDWRFSLGARISSTGLVQDVLTGSPAAKAGLTPSATIVAIDGRRFAPAILTSTIERTARTKAPIMLLVENKQTFQTLTLDYAGGLRQPLLKRNENADILDIISAPRTFTRPAPAEKAVDDNV